MPTFNIRWKTPEGDQSDYIHAEDLRAAQREADARERDADPLGDLNQNLQVALYRDRQLSPYGKLARPFVRPNPLGLDFIFGDLWH